MPNLQFGEFRQNLLKSGVAPRHINRAIAELSDHYDDIFESARASGMTSDRASEYAVKNIGDLRQIGDAIAARKELKTWQHRFPRLAVVCLPIAWLMLLPTRPIFVGVAHAPAIARWGACLMLGALVTAMLLLAMQLSIHYS